MVQLSGGNAGENVSERFLLIRFTTTTMQRTIDGAGVAYTHLIVDADGRLDGLARDIEEIGEMGRFGTLFHFDSDQAEDFDWIDRRLYALWQFIPIAAADRHYVEEAQYRVQQLLAPELV
jgi:hypothetical protein